MNDTQCSACGKELVFRGQLCNAFVTGINDPGTEDIKLRAFLHSCIGTYQLGKTYLICHECLLKALNVKEEE
jgi:hypothetical protein